MNDSAESAAKVITIVNDLFVTLHKIFSSLSYDELLNICRMLLSYKIKGNSNSSLYDSLITWNVPSKTANSIVAKLATVTECDFVKRFIGADKSESNVSLNGLDAIAEKWLRIADSLNLNVSEESSVNCDIVNYVDPKITYLRGQKSINFPINDAVLLGYNRNNKLYNTIVKATERTRLDLNSDSVVDSFRNSETPVPSGDYSDLSHTLSGDKRSMFVFKKNDYMLPVDEKRGLIVNAVKNYQVIIVESDVGSGKSTRIPQILLDEGLLQNGMIAVTQPRRIAAISLAKLVQTSRNNARKAKRAQLQDNRNTFADDDDSNSYRQEHNNEVAYSVRFDDKVNKHTKIRYMTDGILLRECFSNSTLSHYSIIMLDEVHERTLNIDILLALMKRVLEKRKDLRLIISSATLGKHHFDQFYPNNICLHIRGTNYPVAIIYSDEFVTDYITKGVTTVFDINASDKSGDILFFLPGKEDIMKAEKLIIALSKSDNYKNQHTKLVPLRLHARLSSSDQMMVFNPVAEGYRKVILSTDIAEASITVKGIVFVIDSGIVKTNVYNSQMNISSLLPVQISRSSAIQRAGRAGRLQPGVCYRLYTKNSFENEMNENSIPEIKRCSLHEIVLLVKKYVVDNIFDFEFYDPPNHSTLLRSIEFLHALNCINDDNNLTPFGNLAASIPLSPDFTIMILVSTRFNCTLDVLKICSMAQCDNIFLRPLDRLKDADKAHAGLQVSNSDHLTLLNVFNQYINNKKKSQWCNKHFINDFTMVTVVDTFNQLLGICESLNIPLKDHHSPELIKYSICYGLINNTAKKCSVKRCYITYKDKIEVLLHSSSAVKFDYADTIIYQSIMTTKAAYLTCCTAIPTDWLLKISSKLYRASELHDVMKH